MKILTPAATLFAALLASAAVQAATSDSAQDPATGHQHEQNDDASAHGYQNPTGQDPDPRMTEHPNSDPEVVDEDEGVDDEGDSMN